MKQMLIGIAAAGGILTTVGAAQAEIICTNRGCYERNAHLPQWQLLSRAACRAPTRRWEAKETGAHY